MKSLRSLLIVGLFCSVAASVTAGDLLPKLPGNTKIVARLDLDRLRNSKVYSTIEKDNLEKLEKAQTDIASAIGIDVTSVASAWLVGVKKGQGMIVLEGEFDPVSVKEVLSLNPQMKVVERDDVDFAVYVPDKKKNTENLAVILDKSVLAIGNPAFVDTFISAYKGKGKGLSADKLKMASSSLGKKVLFQGILLESPETEQGNNPILAAIQGGNATLDVTDKVTCSANITCDTEKNAMKMTQMLYGLLALYEMKQAQSYKGEIAKESILKNLKITPKGNTISISGGLGPAVVEQLIENVN